MTIQLTTEKAEKLKNCCQEVIDTARPTIRTIAKLLGLMTASFPGVRYGQLYYRRLDMEKTRHFQHTRILIEKCPYQHLRQSTLSGRETLYTPHTMS